MARRHRRTRADELAAHITIGKAVAELCTTLMAMEPQVPDFQFARKILLDGVALLEDEQRAVVAAPAAEEKA